MKKLLFILLLFPLLSIGQDYTDFKPEVAWRTLVDSVVYQNTDTFTVKVNPTDLNDIGAFEKKVGNFLIDNKGRKYKIIDNTTITGGIVLTVVDVFESGAAPFQGLIGYVIKSPGDGFISGLANNYFEELDPKAIDYSRRLDLRIAYEKGQTIPFDSMRLWTGYTPTETEPIGTGYYDADNDTWSIVTEHNIYQVGQELAPLFKNVSGRTMYNGEVAYYAGAVGASEHIEFTSAALDGTFLPSRIVGILTEDIPDNGWGKVTWFGGIRNFNINNVRQSTDGAWAVDDILYASNTEESKMTNVMPNAPYYTAEMCVILSINGSNVTVFTRPTWNWKLSDMADVDGADPTTTGDLLTFDQISGVWDRGVYSISNEAFSDNWEGRDTIVPTFDNLYAKISLFESLNYCADSAVVNFGTIESGTQDSLCAVDGHDLVIAERAQNPPFQVDFVFQGVERLQFFSFYGDYDGGVNHQVHVLAYNVNTLSWDFIGEFGSSTVKRWYSFPIYLPNNYIDNGEVKIRVEHQGAGITAHRMIFDYVEVNFGGTGGGNFITAGSVDFMPYMNITSGNVQGAIQQFYDLWDDTTTVLRGDISSLQAESHPAVTLAGTPDYITIDGNQVITRSQIDLTTDVAGVLPDANVADNITASNYLPLTGGTLTGKLTINKTFPILSLFDSGVSQTGVLTAFSNNTKEYRLSLKYQGSGGDNFLIRDQTRGVNVFEILGTNGQATFNGNLFANNLSGTNTGDQDISGITTNANAIASLESSKQNNISLTTTGTNGASTFISDVLNIPRYDTYIDNKITSLGFGSLSDGYLPYSNLGVLDDSPVSTDGFNVGFNTTDYGVSYFSGWGMTRFGASGTFFYNNTVPSFGINFMRNAYFASDATYKYLNDGFAESLSMHGSKLKFQYATSGTEDNTITWNDVFESDISGNMKFFNKVEVAQSDSSVYAAPLGQIWEAMDKRWVLFGDSYSYLLTSGYPKYVIDRLHLNNTVTHGGSGHTWGHQKTVLDGLISGDANYFDDFDICTILLGINDFGKDSILGDRNSTIGSGSVAGLVKYFIETILTSNPTIELYIMTPPEIDRQIVPIAPYQSRNNAGWTVRELSVLISQICSDYAIPCLDLYSMSQWNLQTIHTVTDDGVHPNTVGSEFIGERLVQTFINRQATGKMTDPSVVTVFDSTIVVHPAVSGDEATNLTQVNGLISDITSALTNPYMTYWNGSNFANSNLSRSTNSTTLSDGRFIIKSNASLGTTAGTGKNLSLYYYEPSDLAVLLSFDYGGSVYKPISMFGSEIKLYNNTTVKATVNSSGVQVNGDVTVTDEAYDPTVWNGSLEVPTKNAVRDKIESLKAVQALSGTTPTLNANSGLNATLTIGGNTTITLSNLSAGQTGNITVVCSASGYTLQFSGYTFKISPSLSSASGVITTTSTASAIDVYSWWYDGTRVIINGTKNYD